MASLFRDNAAEWLPSARMILALATETLIDLVTKDIRRSPRLGELLPQPTVSRRGCAAISSDPRRSARVRVAVTDFLPVAE